ncbi:MAG: sulfatase [Phycisphaeraceae bacterium]
MIKQTILALAFLQLFGLLSLPVLAEDRPNIVWIFVEDMNGWYGCYGDDTVPTPNIDALAKRGVRFDRAYMPAGVCSATRSAIATGAMQTSLGVHNHRSSRKRVPEEVIHLPDGVKTTYQLMREAGYFVTTQGMNKNDFNFIWESSDLYDKVKHGKGLAFPPLWRERKEGQPFFAQIQLAGGKHNFRLKKNQKVTDRASVTVPPYYADQPAIREQIAQHYDTIRITDNEVGQIIAELKADELLENTIVFFWTDHGMGLHRHKQWLYEGGIRVPLIVTSPNHGVAPGSSRDDLINGIDISTTTLALAGVDLEKHSWLEGHDFFAEDHKAREFVVSARDRCDYTIDRVRAVTTKRYKYLRNFMTDRSFMQPQYRDGRDYIEAERKLYQEGKLNEVQAFKWNARVAEELYDLQNDPHEINNLANDPAHAEALAKHRAILDTWIEETDDQGQYAESIDSLRGVLKRWSKQAVNPEYEKAR